MTAGARLDPAEAEAAVEAAAEMIADRVAGKLAGGFAVDRQAMAIITEFCRGEHNLRLDMWGIHDVRLRVAVIGDQAELSLDVDGSSRVWQGILRAAP